MNTKLFFKKKEVWLSLLSLLGQVILIFITSFRLFYTDVSWKVSVILILVLIGFTFIFAVTLLRLANLAKITDSVKKP